MNARSFHVPAAEREFTQAELTEARDELRDEIMAGKTRGGFDLNACLDCELNSDGYTGTVHDLAALIVGKEYEGAPHADKAAMAHYDLISLTEKIVERHIPESAIQDRAGKIREDRREAAMAGEYA